MARYAVLSLGCHTESATVRGYLYKFTFEHEHVKHGSVGFCQVLSPKLDAISNKSARTSHKAAFQPDAR
eukprot:5000965-Pyramimonas_sp.AAC.1